ncbi:hypothetical protein MMC28_003800 [Mycoblastus sanguinarius]|nr:hypothetical protein [Mycoblastus sanguinarius]
MTGQKVVDPFAKFYALRDRHSLSVREAQRRPSGMAWDPWPVKNFKKDSLFYAAQELVRVRNSKCIKIWTDQEPTRDCKARQIDICTEKATVRHQVTLLPASGNIAGIQGGSLNVPLYSLRSANTLPIRVHLWLIPPVDTWTAVEGCFKRTPAKIMVRKGQRTESFSQFLNSFGIVKDDGQECDLCKHCSCWKSVKINDEWLNSFPIHFRQKVYKRWFSFNGFRFLELPPELREEILVFAMGPIVEPFRQTYSPFTPQPQTRPNMRLALVSSQLYQEVMPVLFKNATFSFRSYRQLSYFFGGITHSAMEPTGAVPRKVSPASLNALSSLELNMNASGLLAMLGVSLFADHD